MCNKKKLARLGMILLEVILILATALLCLQGVGVYLLRQRAAHNGAVSFTLPGAAADGSYTDDGGQLLRARENQFTLLVVGVDRANGTRADRGIEWAVGMADALLVATVDLDDGTVSLLSVPRDTITTLGHYSATGKLQKTVSGQIALQYHYGGSNAALRTNATAKTVSNTLAGLQIDACIAVDMGLVIKLTDALEGVPVVVPEDEAYCAFTGYRPGQWVLLDGEASLQFIQYRDKSVFASAQQRTERQKVWLNALMDALYQQLRENPLKCLDMALELAPCYYTDLTAMDMVGLASTLLWRGLDVNALAMHTLPGQTLPGDPYEQYVVDTDAMQDVLVEMYYVNKEA